MQGATPEAVRRALDSGDPLPGTRGFAGEVDGTFVRDVLGRYPLFVDGDDWARSPSDLSDPVSFPAGHARPADAPRAEPERVWTLPDPDPIEDERAAVRNVRDALAASLDDANEADGESDAGEADGDTDPDPSTAVAFSGGVDSAVVASRIDGPLYVAGFPESHDVTAARDAARAMGREGDLRVIELSLDDVEGAVPEVARATGRTNAMDVAIALPLYLVAERAAADGHDRLAVGQGADELFGGYAKIARAPDDPRVDADTVRGARREVLGTLPDQLERDVLALRGAGVEPVAPLLDDRVIAAALSLPGESLVDDRGERKRALRLAAREFVPDGVAFREKKAVQYGSLVSRELDRLARRAGFKRRTDDHVSRYVASRIR
ncbi:asparagine synthetase B [Halostella sp. JP-L12]|uniref:asparagine synthase C-terminal domain-containing protein n=1 Tax=Halostella TaxID=1843185 RepID=UPI000EF77CEC|nr:MULTISPECIES: asparagine synthase-related protein [Halostella]NHN49649.1 asparagine synthetase B [Halostella sp. JP-L12]